MSDVNQIFGPKGDVISEFAKTKPPKLGNSYGSWAGRDYSIFELPGGSFLQFDLSKLRLSDFRQMLTHYQINSSLSMLAFMQHQSNWKILHSQSKVRDLLTENLTDMWTQLIRMRSQANWAGFSPSALEWDNYEFGQRPTTRVTKIKDFLPEECLVHWKDVPLFAPPGQIPEKEKIYDGIDKFGSRNPIPIPNSFWYPLLMENGNYYGRKLLRAVYTSYFFSQLIHLYANRYYERFGEPTPIGRAPFDDNIEVKGQSIAGSELMLNMLQNLRSRGVVLLPSDKVPDGGSSNMSHYEYDIDYLESQMRGADFERMLTRYDQEMSLGTFTPLLLQQTADVGSYNLGGLHFQMYLMTQNAMNNDFAMYLNKYFLYPIIKYNFSQSTEPARIVFERQDNQKLEIAKMIIQAKLSNGTMGIDVDEVGQAVGLTLTEIAALKPASDPANPDNVPGGGKNKVPAGQTGDPSGN